MIEWLLKLLLVVLQYWILQQWCLLSLEVAGALAAALGEAVTALAHALIAVAAVLLVLCSALIWAIVLRIRAGGPAGPPGPDPAGRLG